MKPKNPDITSKDVMIDNYLKTSDGRIVQVTKIHNDYFACGFPYLWDYNNLFMPILIEDVKSHIDKEILDELEYINIINGIKAIYVHNAQNLLKFFNSKSIIKL